MNLKFIFFFLYIYFNEGISINGLKDNRIHKNRKSLGFNRKIYIFSNKSISIKKSFVLVLFIIKSQEGRFNLFFF